MKLADLGTRIKVIMLRWISRLAKESNTFPAFFIKKLAQCNNLYNFFLAKPKKIPLGIRNIPFYGSMIRVWNDLFEPMTEPAVRREGLWNNSFITNGKGSCLYHRKWERAGIVSIHDI